LITRGSEWHRWELHIHAPGTVLNDQFGGQRSWDAYVTAIEKCEPAIEAIAVTDYYITDTYEEVVRRKEEGYLPGVKLIFPNVEMRLETAARTGFINLHLLVSPEDREHVNRLNEFLSQLTFHACGENYSCTKDSLTRLGKVVGSPEAADREALAVGVTQVKVNLTQLRTAFNASDWAKKNIIFAVAGAAGDGTSGLQAPSDQVTRQEIEKFAHVIFASSPAQREFWLGEGKISAEELENKYGGKKPCLHGSDAHRLQDVGMPAENRFCWIKGALTFDSLRQACIDPKGRAYVGKEPPKSPIPSQVISQVDIGAAPWMTTRSLPLNAGLVAIIGARGSGKTALAEMIAAGCDATNTNPSEVREDISSSFLSRARKFIEDANVTLNWGSGDPSCRELKKVGADSATAVPRARYLSQQFVEELCSSRGASEGLVREIERVIFDAHTDEVKEGAYSFDSLRSYRIGRFQKARHREVEAIEAASDRIAEELEKEGLIVSLKAQKAAKETLIKGYSIDLSKLEVKATSAQVQRHNELGDTLQKLTAKVHALGGQKRSFLAMQDEAESIRMSKAPEMLRETMTRYPESGLIDEQWDDFLLVHKGDVESALKNYIKLADQQMNKLTGMAPTVVDSSVSLIPVDANLADVQLAVIKAEMARIEAQISADTVIQDHYATLSKKLTREKAALATLITRLDDATAASTRRRALQTERALAYKKLFDAIVNEQRALVDLYEPLMEQLKKTAGTLEKISFKVSRTADVARWAIAGEKDLIDCRKAGDFNGRGALQTLATTKLKPIWETGSADDVHEAMSDFIEEYHAALLAHMPNAPDGLESTRNWLRRFAHWLYSTEHISVQYEILYDGIEIGKLSPGTRGIVLLLLYLALDGSDDRPLIIDQPEENLDPKSVFDELVPLFIAAKSKRQVIIVTHNANLVVNTDADQIIVAETSPATGDGLPSFKYVGGGLEDVKIRKVVCDILEGGEKAFRERARRLRVQLGR
jgi:hypothetical protein